MELYRWFQCPFSVRVWCLCLVLPATLGMTRIEKNELRLKVLEMFDHAYGNYMDNAYPADELMPLSCRGRHRGTQPSRGDVDDILGNFSLTLIDTLDSLAVLGKISEFEHAVRLIMRDVTFDSDIVVSVFETNIRVLGGLLGGHVMAANFKNQGRAFEWYNNELLEMAKDVGYRLLPAFNTTTGIPYPRVNLRYGLRRGVARTGHERDTCTSCAGTMILEFAALSRLSGETIFEEKARKAMNFLWKQRHRSSDLVGTVINIHTGDWIRRESGVGAGIDSYYEYLLKAYILLGDETYLDRFNKHYEAVMKYVSQGPLLVDVHMHRPLTNSRNFMDALLAFWPGLQVLKGDIKPAIEMHEMLYQVMQRHNFLPEAFTTDFRVHWAQHPLRPEFIESTYFLHKATSDPYYLHVGRTVIENLEAHARVPCGYAALKDVTSSRKEDQMDSFVLAEMFKYLYLLFTDPEDLVFSIDDYIFTTEAHLLPLSLSINSAVPSNNTATDPVPAHVYVDEEADGRFLRSCPNTNHLFPGNANYAHSIRSPLKNMVESVCPRPKNRKKPPIRASEFIAGDKEQMEQLRQMGIRIVTLGNGMVQLQHTAAEASSPEDAEAGRMFMEDMSDLSKRQALEVQQDPRVVQLLSPPYLGNTVFNAGPAQFGHDLKAGEGVYGVAVVAPSIKGCQPLEPSADVRGKIVLLERGDCMFIDKARHIEAAGALAGIVMDHNEGSTSDSTPLFAMSGDSKSDVSIPMVFLFNVQGRRLREAIETKDGALRVYLGLKPMNIVAVVKYLLRQRDLRGSGSFTWKDPTTVVTGPPVPPPPRTAAAPSDPAAAPGEPAAAPGDPAAPQGPPYRTISFNIGALQLQLKKQSAWARESERLLDIVEGKAPVTDDLITSSSAAHIGKVLDDVLLLLSQHTNFKSLDKPAYLKAIGDVVEAAFMSGPDAAGAAEPPRVNAESQAALEQLGQQLKPVDAGADVVGTVRRDVGGEDVIVSLVKKPPEQPEAPQRGRWLKEEVLQAPSWMNLKDGELYVDRSGVMYVADLQRFLDAQGVAPPDLLDQVQSNAHTIIFGDEQEGTVSEVDEDGNEVPCPDGGVAADLGPPPRPPASQPPPPAQQQSRDASSTASTSQDSVSHSELNPADAPASSANDDLIVTSESNTRTASTRGDSQSSTADRAQNVDSIKVPPEDQESGQAGPRTPEAHTAPTGGDPRLSNSQKSTKDTQNKKDEL